MPKRTKLTDEQKQEIREEYAKGGVSYPALAAKYDVSSHTIMRICNDKYYQAQLEANRNYQQKNIKDIYKHRQKNYKSFRLTLHNENDATIIEKLESVDNYAEYLRSLVLDDIQKEESGKKEN